LPTNAIFSTLLSGSIVLEKAIRQTGNLDCGDHFAKLCSLPLGTALVLHANGKLYKAKHDGVDSIDGKKCLRVMVHKRSAGGLTHLISKSQAVQVQVKGTGVTKLPQKQKGRSENAQTRFLSGMLGETDLHGFLNSSSLECIIVGHIKRIHHDALAKIFAVKTENGTYEAGNLQAILRLKRFSGEGQTYKADALPARAKRLPVDIEGSVPDILVFDGAKSFLKWHPNWPNSHWVVLLDRTEREFGPAVEKLNKLQKIGSPAKISLEVPTSKPAGAELTAFTRS